MNNEETIKGIINFNQRAESEIRTLREQVNILNGDYDELVVEKENLQTRIDKAIEYIESYNLPDDLKGMSEAPITIEELKTLLNILRGKNK